MIDNVCVSSRILYCSEISDIVLDDAQPRALRMILEPGNVRLRAAPQHRIENGHIETIGEETVDQIRTNETGPACYKHPHFWSSRLVCHVSQQTPCQFQQFSVENASEH